MRRTPYTERGNRIGNPLQLRQPGDFLTYTGTKPELIPRSSNNISVYIPAKSPKPYYLATRTTKSQTKRPLSMNKSNSALQNQSNQTSLKAQEREEQKARNKQLFVSTVKDNKTRHLSRDFEQTKGKIYRGSSWRPDERSKSSTQNVRQDFDQKKFSKGRYLSNLTPTTKE